MINIKVNGMPVQLFEHKVTYARLVELAGETGNPSMVVKIRGVDGKIVSPGDTIELMDGARVTVAHTGAA